MHLSEFNPFSYFPGPVLIISSFFSFISLHENQVNVIEYTKNITLHAKRLNIRTDVITINRLNQPGGSNIPIDRTEVNTKYDFFIIHTMNELVKGNKYKLTIPFDGEASIGLLGYYRSSYIDLKTNTEQ